MRLFIISYFAGVALMILGSLSSVMEAPLDIIPRICFYFGFPVAVLISMGVIFVLHFLSILFGTVIPQSMSMVADKDSKKLETPKVA